MLMAVARGHEGDELEFILGQPLVYANAMSLRNSASPPVIMSSRCAIFFHEDWDVTQARDYAALRNFAEPVDVEVPEGFINSLPVRGLGSAHGANR